MIVGNHGVGKTSLIHCLLKDQRLIKEDYTKFVDVFFTKIKIGDSSLKVKKNYK